MPLVARAALITGAQVQYAGDDVCGAHALDSAESQDLCAEFEHDFLADYLSSRAALDQYVGAERFEQFAGSVFVEYRHVIDAFERPEHFRPLHLPYHRAGRAFETLDAFIRVNRDDKAVAQATGFLKIANVSDVQQVKTPIGEHDALFERPASRQFTGKSIPVQQLRHTQTNHAFKLGDD